MLKSFTMSTENMTEQLARIDFNNWKVSFSRIVSLIPWKEGGNEGRGAVKSMFFELPVLDTISRVLSENFDHFCVETKSEFHNSGEKPDPRYGTVLPLEDEGRLQEIPSAYSFGANLACLALKVLTDPYTGNRKKDRILPHPVIVQHALASVSEEDASNASEIISLKAQTLIGRTSLASKVTFNYPKLDQMTAHIGELSYQYLQNPNNNMYAVWGAKAAFGVLDTVIEEIRFRSQFKFL